MRILPFITGTVVTIALVFALDNRWGSIPALGRFLSPQQGFWQNAEADGLSRNETIEIPGLLGKADVYLDDRLVPHIFAEHDEDAYFIQGYLHAKYRLWQMEFQTLAAAGRISEKMGDDPRFLNYDREKRRSGMVSSAKKAQETFEADPVSKATCDAYTKGVNAYISSLTPATLPFEYKLLGYSPEPWSNLKIALFLKEMSKTLAGTDYDLQKTRSKSVLPFDLLMQLDPEVPDSLVPMIPAGTAFDTAGIRPVAPTSADSLYFGKKDSIQVTEVNKPDPSNGSNNWVVAGSKTSSGYPILCNDPHLELSFPSIWYEMQITTPNVNVYGVSFPGSPNIVIGFNDNIAWGVTNSQRDVRDYYQIQFQDESRQAYLFNGKWVPTELQIDTIKVRGSADVIDTTAYTVFGPVVYDRSFSSRLPGNSAVALRWTAHDASNEGLTFYKLNRAKNYTDYLEAIKTFTCPGQNFVFASHTGDIALWQQGKFPARWYGQGVYVMPGIDSSYMWQGFIPQTENPHAVNPPSGFLESANQRPVDSTYPYFIPGNYITQRGSAIARQLSAMNNIRPEDMMRLQNDYHSYFGESVKRILLRYVQEDKLDVNAKRYLSMLREWDGETSASSTGATVYQRWLDSLQLQIWGDEWKRDSLSVWSTRLQQDSMIVNIPDEETLFETLSRDSAFAYVDNVNTPGVEDIYSQVTAALIKATGTLKEDESNDRLEWGSYKDPVIYHLLRDAVMPFARKIHVGGWGNVINATKKSHGPSWRMIVQMSSPTEAYGVYPGGQSGNPGSRFYDNFVDNWEHGKYFRLWVMKPEEKSDKRIIGTLHFTKK